MPTIYEAFESRTCRRCGGEGRILTYSHVLGGTCFRCSGAKFELTERGARDHAAHRAAVDAVTVRPVADMRVGDFVRSENMRKYVQVKEIGTPRLSSWTESEGVRREHYQTEVTLAFAVYHDLHCPLSYTGDTFSIDSESTIRIHPGKGNVPLAVSFDSRRSEVAA